MKTISTIILLIFLSVTIGKAQDNLPSNAVSKSVLLSEGDVVKDLNTNQIIRVAKEPVSISELQIIRGVISIERIPGGGLKQVEEENKGNSKNKEKSAESKLKGEN